METIDIILDLLEKGKNLYNTNLEGKSNNPLVENNEEILKIINLINILTGFERSSVVTDYIMCRTNLKDTILSIVIDEPRELLAPISITPLHDIDAPKNNVILMSANKGPRDKYNEESCIDALLRASVDLGETFTRMEYTRYTREHKGFPHSLTIIRHVGGNYRSWDNVMRTAGLQPKKIELAK